MKFLQSPDRCAYSSMAALKIAAGLYLVGFSPYTIQSVQAETYTEATTSQPEKSESSPEKHNDDSKLFSLQGVRIDAGYTYDDNISRADEANDRISAQIYSINISKTLQFQLSPTVRFVLNGFGGGETLNHYNKLGRVFIGAQGELQYRASGDFGSPIFGVFIRTTQENFNSQLRDGHRFTAGVSVREPITDRINLFGALSYNNRHARDDTFDTKDRSIRINLDYSVFANSTLYLTGEYRRGDAVFSGPPTLEAVDMASALTMDDVFTKQGFWDYRVWARTVLTTIGYNYPLGPMSSFDISWRRAESNPIGELSFDGTKPSYVDNQVSIVFLKRF